jgi:hypothetical protein
VPSWRPISSRPLRRCKCRPTSCTARSRRRRSARPRSCRAYSDVALSILSAVVPLAISSDDRLYRASSASPLPEFVSCYANGPCSSTTYCRVLSAGHSLEQVDCWRRVPLAAADREQHLDAAPGLRRRVARRRRAARASTTMRSSSTFSDRCRSARPSASQPASPVGPRCASRCRSHHRCSRPSLRWSS